MGISLQSNGILNTLQDAGRNGYRALGINPNGAMDISALRLINILLGNDEFEAALEIHFPAPGILFEKDAVIALGGADFGAEADEKPLENWKAHPIKKGSIMKFRQKLSGARQYLAVKGGFQCEKWLGSASPNLTAGIGSPLKKGESIEFKKNNSIPPSDLRIGPSLIPFYSPFPTIRIMAGPDFLRLTALSENHFLKKSFAIAPDSNRMGFRLNGPPLYLLDETSLISSAVTFGSIQLLPDGQLIVLMADHQTTGGYPQIANVFSNDLPLLAQLNPGDKLAFHLISLEEAERSLFQYEKDLNFLKIGLQFSQS